LLRQGGKVAAAANKIGQLYRLRTEERQQAAVAAVFNMDLWHQRYGHANIQMLKQLQQFDLVDGLSTGDGGSELDFCEACVQGKQQSFKSTCKSRLLKQSFKSSKNSRSDEILGVVHSDVCGPMKNASLGGAYYFVTFTDSFSRFCSVYFMKSKSEVLSKFKEYEALATTQTGCRVKTLRTDKGGEYTSKEFEEFCKQRGILHQTSVPYTPEQNGVAERMNRTLVESARSMIFQGSLDVQFWAEAVSTAAYLRNRCPTNVIGNATPYQLWTGIKPNVEHLKVFGCIAYAHVPQHQRGKFDSKTRKVRFLGYAPNAKGCIDLCTSKVFLGRDVIFNEHQFADTTIEGRND
jgi:transposase InsO family protein